LVNQSNKEKSEEGPEPIQEKWNAEKAREEIGIYKSEGILKIFNQPKRLVEFKAAG